MITWTYWLSNIYAQKTVSLNGFIIREAVKEWPELAAKHYKP